LENAIDEILKMAELTHLQFSPLKEISWGQSQRLAVSTFFQTTSDFLIFDESLSFVDQYFAEKCKEYFQDLCASERTIIMTSHESSILKKHCNQAIWLDGGTIRMSGDVDQVIEAYEQTLS
jgi:ABC-type polysaccharide/polyol phosphate transport system ATPase subunit